MNSLVISSETIVPNIFKWPETIEQYLRFKGNLIHKLDDFSLDYDLNYDSNHILKISGIQSDFPDKKVYIIQNNNNVILCEIPCQNDQIHGLMKFFFDFQQLEYQIPFENNQRQGIQRKFNEQGIEIEQILWQSNMKQETKRYFETGELKQQISQKNDKDSGPFFTYNKEGQLIRYTEYLEGFLHGDDIIYNNTGSIQCQCEWILDEKEGVEVKYYLQGAVKKEIIWVFSQKQGQSVQYYESGEIQKQTQYVNDLKDGDQRYFYKSGQVMKEIQWYYGQKCNIETHFSEDGQITQQIQHKYRDSKFSKSIRKYSQTPMLNQYDQCSICFEESNLLVDPIALLCSPKHIFCYQCIIKYLEASGALQCPICRKDIPYQELWYNENETVTQIPELF